MKAEFGQYFQKYLILQKVLLMQNNTKRQKRPKH